MNIIKEDWSDYNLRKMRIGNNVDYFQPFECWEVNYLADKILKYYPFQDKNLIKGAVNSFTENTSGPYKREVIIEQVMVRLGLN